MGTPIENWLKTQGFSLPEDLNVLCDTFSLSEVDKAVLAQHRKEYQEACDTVATYLSKDSTWKKGLGLPQIYHFKSCLIKSYIRFFQKIDSLFPAYCQASPWITAYRSTVDPETADIKNIIDIANSVTLTSRDILAQRVRDIKQELTVNNLAESCVKDIDRGPYFVQGKHYLTQGEDDSNRDLLTFLSTLTDQLPLALRQKGLLLISLCQSQAGLDQPAKRLHNTHADDARNDTHDRIFAIQPDFSKSCSLSLDQSEIIIDSLYMYVPKHMGEKGRTPLPWHPPFLGYTEFRIGFDSRKENFLFKDAHYSFVQAMPTFQSLFAVINDHITSPDDTSDDTSHDPYRGIALCDLTRRMLAIYHPKDAAGMQQKQELTAKLTDLKNHTFDRYWSNLNFEMAFCKYAHQHYPAFRSNIQERVFYSLDHVIAILTQLEDHEKYEKVIDTIIPLDTFFTLYRPRWWQWIRWWNKSTLQERFDGYKARYVNDLVSTFCHTKDTKQRDVIFGNHIQHILTKPSSVLPIFLNALGCELKTLDTFVQKFMEKANDNDCMRLCSALLKHPSTAQHFLFKSMHFSLIDEVPSVDLKMHLRKKSIPLYELMQRAKAAGQETTTQHRDIEFDKAIQHFFKDIDITDPRILTQLLLHQPSLADPIFRKNTGWFSTNHFAQHPDSVLDMAMKGKEELRNSILQHREIAILIFKAPSVRFKSLLRTHYDFVKRVQDKYAFTQLPNLQVYQNWKPQPTSYTVATLSLRRGESLPRKGSHNSEESRSSDESERPDPISTTSTTNTASGSSRDNSDPPSPVDPSADSSESSTLSL